MISKILARLGFARFALNRVALVCLALVGVTLTGFVASSAPAGPEAQIRAILERQEFDWNRGDTDGFLLGYADDAVFVSDKITRGIEEVRVRYQSHYPTRASMGHLSFSDIEVHMIDPANAYVIGLWRLQRDADGGGDTNGVYTLLFKKTVKGWKIVLDHTT